MNFQEENEKLIKANAALVEAINVSKLALEESKKQEEEGEAILSGLAKDLETMVASTEVARKELHKTNYELEKIQAEKTKVELSIADAQKAATDSLLEEKAKYEAKFQTLRSDIEVKQNELTEVLGKTRSEVFNLNTVKGEISLLNVELMKAKSRLDDITAATLAKEAEFNALTNDIDAAQTKLNKTLQTLKDTEISTEAYEDRKATLIAELAVLEENIIAGKNNITGIKAEITELEAHKAAKEAEYKTSEAKVFQLIEREEALNERETYAKDRFKIAGLEY